MIGYRSLGIRSLPHVTIGNINWHTEIPLVVDNYVWKTKFYLESSPTDEISHKACQI